MRFLRSSSITRSISRNGYRCGRILRISPISITGLEGISAAVVWVVFIIHQVQRRRLYCSAPPGSKMSRAVSKKVRGSVKSVEAQRRLADFSEHRDAMVATIRELVEIESPSESKRAVDTLAEVVAARFAVLGGSVRF